jgi:hypothetical protein
MKKCLLFTFFSGSLLLNASCDPDVAGEGVNLPQLNYPFKVSPDTAYIKIGDTLTIQSSISSTLANGIKITNGQSEIKCYIGFWGTVPITDPDNFDEVYDGKDYKIIAIAGAVKYNDKVDGLVLGLTTTPGGDSLKMNYKIIFNRKGVFQFSFYSGFYEGSKGKTRTRGYFNVPDPNWNELWKLSDNPAPLPGTTGYNENYLIGVVD